HVVAERAPNRLHALAVLARIRVVDLHLVVAAAELGVALRLTDQVVDPVSRPPATPVGGDPVGHRPPELIYRKAGRLAGDVPEPDVERRDRVGGHTLTLDPAIAAEHALPEALDEERVLADDQRGQARVEVDLDRLRTPTAEGQAVAEAGDALVGRDLRDDELVVGELQRDRLLGRDGEDAGLDAGDFHRSNVLA